MTKPSRIAAYLLTFATAAALMSARAQSANDEPPPVPYGTQQSMKLKALVDAAPFMAASEDRVVTLKQERLRLCVEGLTYRFEAHAAGQESSFTSFAEPLAQLHDAWLALCATNDQKMPMLEFALQLAEQRESSSQALFEQGRLSAIETLAAKRDRLTAEIEMIECQRAMSSASVR